MSWFGNYLNTLFKLSPFGAVLNTGKKLFNLGSELNGEIKNYADSWLNAQTGAGPTGAALQVQQYETQERLAAQDWTAKREDTEMQRRVADLTAAGLNPMLAVGSGGVSSSSSGMSAPSSTGAASSLSDLLGIIRLKSELDLNKAHKENIDKDTQAKEAGIKATEAATAKQNAETTGIDLDNQLKQLTLQMKVEAQELENEYKKASTRKFWREIDEISARIGKIAAETETESARQMLFKAESWLKNCEASQILQLLPYEKKLRDSQSVLNAAKTEEARAAAQNQYAQASLAAVHESYQQGLIDIGYIDSLAREMAAKAGIAESSEDLAAIKAGLRSGKWPDSLMNRDFLQSISPEGVMQDITIILDNLNPLAGLFK